MCLKGPDDFIFSYPLFQILIMSSYWSVDAGLLFEWEYSILITALDLMQNQIW